MPSAILASLRAKPEAPALIHERQQLSYAALEEEVERLAQYLGGQHCVALCMENSPAWIVADLACVKAGVICVPLPPFFSDEQMRHAMRDAGVSLLITDHRERFAGSAETIAIAGQDYYALPQANEKVAYPKNTAKITYTSGTTGTPKGVCLSQEAMETVARSLLAALGTEVAARHVCLLPLAVLLENVAGVYTALLAGATCYFPPVRHEPEALANAIRESKATSCILVPELLRALLAARTPLPSLKFAAVGGARVDPALLEAAQAADIPVYEGYGLSEASSVVTLNLPGANRPGTAGRVLPHVGLRVSESGEILLRDPLYSGYLGSHSPKPTWYATGDLGHLDAEGFLHIDGRKRHVFINSFGRNVSPEWPESLLAAHPAILQAAVFGEAMPFAVAVIVPRGAADIPAALTQINARLPDYARIGAYVLAGEAFTVANGKLTGTGRNRREAIEKAYAEQLANCYRMEKTA